MGGPHLQEAAFLEDVANELVQVHEALVIADVVGEDGQHHGVLWWRTRRKRGVNQRQTWEGEDNLRIWRGGAEAEREESEEEEREQEEDTGGGQGEEERIMR